MVDGVKLVSTLYNTGEVRVAEFHINPVSTGSHHSHTSVNELCICLEGQMLVHQQGMPSLMLLPGQQTTIAAGVVHQVENSQASPCRYMVIQGPGKYDLIRSPPLQTDQQSSYTEENAAHAGSRLKRLRVDDT